MFSAWHRRKARRSFDARRRLSRVRPGIELLESRRMLALTVTTSVDEDDAQNGTVDAPAGPNGVLSLREAINWINKGNDSGITLGTSVSATMGSLPEITPAITFDGAGFTITGSFGNGLTLKGGGTVKNLTINSFSRQIQLEATGTIQDCFVGTNNDGTARVGSGSGIVVAGGTGNLIKNSVISGTSLQIFLKAGSTTVEDCSIGTNKEGTAGLGGDLGIFAWSSDNVLKNNVVSGLTGNAISLTLGTNNLVVGNFVGTDKKGEKKIGNGGDGIVLDQAARNNTIGGTTPAVRNIVSGNSGDGISIGGSSTNNNIVAGNYIGTDVTGEKAIANGKNGVKIRNAARGNTIGGATAAARNLISGNGEDGVLVTDSTPRANIISGNYIGTNVDATKALGNGDDGVDVTAAAETTIGGATAAEGNVISGNKKNGVAIRNGASKNKVQANYIGINKSGANLGNGEYGVYISGSENTIGAPVNSTDAVLGNWIAYSGQIDRSNGDGVAVKDGDRNTIRLNQIFANERLGIDLGDNFFDRYDRDEFGKGPNSHQWHPTIISVVPSTGTIWWMLNSTPTTTFTIDVYSDSQNDFRDYAQGEQLEVVPFQVTTDANGHAEFVTVTSSTTNITATATDDQGNTSEFSLADADGDALCDTWETSSGIDIEGDDIPELTLTGADPLHKNLYVEVDAMSGFAPAQATLNRVRDAFAVVPNELMNNPDGQPGITLEAKVNETGLIASGSGADFPNGWSDYFSVKAGHFGTIAERADSNWDQIKIARQLAYRYCIFAGTVWDSGISGLTESLPGNDFMVTLGSLAPSATPEEQAGTFMHEFGHALGLHHGGGGSDWYGEGDEINWKPNYHSIMNYQWQVPSSDHAGWRLDYSRQAFQTLNEAALNEANGLGGPVPATGHAGDFVEIGPPDLLQFAPEFGPVDINQDGEIGIVAQDLNYLQNEPPSPGQILLGHEDWSQLWYAFQELPGAVDGITAPVAPELDVSDFQRLLPSGPNLPPAVDLLDDVDLDEGDRFSLVAVASDPDGDFLTYAWDLNGDGDFSDASSAEISLSWAELQALGINDGPGSYDLKVRVDDGHGHVVDSIAAKLTVNNTAPTATFSGPGGSVVVGASASFAFTNLFDPSSADTAAGFTYSYDFNNDGDFTDPGEFVNVAAAAKSFSFEQTGTFTVHGRITDQDGGANDYTTTVTVVDGSPAGSAILTGVRATGFLNIATLRGSIVDADPTQTYTLTIHWGDDRARTINFAAGTTSFTVRHFYTSLAALHTVDVTLHAEDGGTSTAQTPVRGLLGELLQFPWHNQVEAADVNQDNQVSAIDLLFVAEALNTSGNGLLTADVVSDLLVDTNGDGQLSAIDLLMVVDRLNAKSTAPQAKSETQLPAAPEELALLQIVSEIGDPESPEFSGGQEVARILNDAVKILSRTAASASLPTTGQLAAWLADYSWNPTAFRGLKAKSASSAIDLTSKTATLTSGLA